MVLLGQLGLVFFALLWLYSRKYESKLYDYAWTLLKRHAILIGFALILLSTLFSIYYSDIAELEPCRLCWYQRIIVFPQLLILAVALWKRDNTVWHYILPINIAGLLVSLYHYAIQMVPSISPPCSVDGISCSASPFFVFGYITIPLMVATIFVMMIVLCFAMKGSKLRRFVR
jgi:disulfide bond formation protein DsbB